MHRMICPGGAGDGGMLGGGGRRVVDDCAMACLPKKRCSAIAKLSLHRPGLALRRDTQPSLVSTLDGASCDLSRGLPRAPCVLSRIVQDSRALNSPTNRTTSPAIAKKTIESRNASRPISPWRAVAFHPGSAVLACECGVAPCGSGSDGGGDEGGVSGGGGEGRGGEGVDGGASGGGAGFGGEGVPAEMLPGVGGILGGDGCGRTDGGGTIT